jgi:hypothetical protein
MPSLMEVDYTESENNTLFSNEFSVFIKASFIKIKKPECDLANYFPTKSKVDISHQTFLGI